MRPTENMDRQTKQTIVKPSCVIGYSKNMGTVDRTDMMIGSNDIKNSFFTYWISHF
jgi:hypothetical protein